MSSPFQRPSNGSRSFAADFPGTCEDCQESFEAGTLLRYDGDDLVHADPDECLQFRDRPINKPCSKCFLVHAGECF